MLTIEKIVEIIVLFAVLFRDKTYSSDEKETLFIAVGTIIIFLVITYARRLITRPIELVLNVYNKDTRKETVINYYLQNKHNCISVDMNIIVPKSIHKNAAKYLLKNKQILLCFEAKNLLLQPCSIANLLIDSNGFDADISGYIFDNLSREVPYTTAYEFEVYPDKGIQADCKQNWEIPFQPKIEIINTGICNKIERCKEQLLYKLIKLEVTSINGNYYNISYRYDE